MQFEKQEDGSVIVQGESLDFVRQAFSTCTALQVTQEKNGAVVITTKEQADISNTWRLINLTLPN